MSLVHHTAAESKAHNISVMGDALGTLYSALSDQVTWLYRKWEEYVVLFGTTPARVDLLNQAAPAFFRLVQDSLFEDVLLHIARLTDRATVAGKPNVTVRALADLVDHQPTQNSVIALVNLALTATAFCRDWRNRRIAHNDFDLLAGASAQPLLPASRAQVRAALQSLEAILNAVSLHYRGNATMFDLGGDPGGAERLLYVIDDGLKAETARRDRIVSGMQTAEDFAGRSL